ncbi:MAG: SLATT domain-containing protein [Pseudomonadota bacterium]|nr:SLATT domain-containing protein [Pseudomonadota bacterium]
MSDRKAAIARECERIEEDALHSAKGHFNTEAGWNRKHLALGIGSVLVASVAGQQAFVDNTYVAAALAFLAAFLAGLATFLSPEKRAEAHGRAGRHYSSLKNRTRVLRTVDLPNLDDEEARQRLETASEQRNDLNETGPGIPRWAYMRAKKDIDARMGAYRADGEQA